MRKLTHSAVGLIVSVILFAGCGADSGGDASLDRESAEATIRSEHAAEARYDDMVRVLQLDVSTQGALRTALAARDSAVEAWISGVDGQRMIALEAQMLAAAKSKDLAAVKRATAEATPLRSALRTLVADHEAAILGVLRPDQRIQWDGHLIAEKMLTLMQPLQLSMEQTRALESGAVTALQQATNAGEPNPKAAAFLALEKWAEESMLSPEQRAAYSGIKDDNKLRSLSL